MADSTAIDKRAIDELVGAFFGAFTNTRGPPDVRRLHDLCIPEAVIVKAVAEVPEVYSLRAFIEPREQLLTSGRLTGFEEWEVGDHTTIAGNVAQRVSRYRKRGVQDGKPFESQGVKVLQFVRTPAGWRLSAAAWDDERAGFDPALLAL